MSITVHSETLLRLSFLASSNPMPMLFPVTNCIAEVRDGSKCSPVSGAFSCQEGWQGETSLLTQLQEQHSLAGAPENAELDATCRATAMLLQQVQDKHKGVFPRLQRRRQAKKRLKQKPAGSKRRFNSVLLGLVSACPMCSRNRQLIRAVQKCPE